MVGVLPDGHCDNDGGILRNLLEDLKPLPLPCDETMPFICFEGMCAYDLVTQRSDGLT